MERVSTGILNLDSQLGGGFPAGSVILILEDPGAGAEVFSYHFIHEGIKRGEKSLYISTNDTSDEVKESMKLYLNLTDEDLEKVKFIDFMGARVGTLGLRESITLSGDPYNRVITECSKDYKRVVLNNLWYFAEDYDRKAVIGMLESMAVSARKNSSVILVLFTKGMFESTFETAVKQVVDGVIELSIREAETEIQRRMKIIKLKRTLVPKAVFRYDITDRGIRMESVTRVL
ncbi:RecA-superfamily ATPases implicated in signal transduction [Geoglobus ahangari]|uniref:RecA-superfamily ATPases implicated in signal transduction n=1 Tax=Geoglobus ahangari TaxID=113653 RepID=A0A0F7IGF8_9EURY|nr:RAD55 family ATPase [Geoglobus ahangari]AKG91712.1 RecA-superfamily ATPases implicated in signal transduction [Geoglobus ahangari]NOY11407.1 hypothetical protein [Archaeoglobi archaeon]